MISPVDSTSLDPAASPRPRTALIVHAHPEPRSFSSAQAEAAAEQLRAEGWPVDRIDLHAEDWDPVLRATQFPADDYFKPQAAQLTAVREGTLGDPVASHLRRVQEADLLILSFPLWWFSMPAIMKGWVDRVFAMGATFGGEHGIFTQGGLAGKQAMLLLTTGGAEESFGPDAVEGYGLLETFLFHIHRGMFEFVGLEPLSPVVTFGPAHLDDTERAAALDVVRGKVSAVGRR